MIAYIFNKSDRVIINKVENVVGTNDISVYSNEVTFLLGVNNDFIISDKIYNFGENVPIIDTNKIIKSPIEIIRDTQSQIVLSLVMGGLM